MQVVQASTMPRRLGSPLASSYLLAGKSALPGSTSKPSFYCYPPPCTLTHSLTPSQFYWAYRGCVSVQRDHKGAPTDAFTPSTASETCCCCHCRCGVRLWWHVRLFPHSFSAKVRTDSSDFFLNRAGGEYSSILDVYFLGGLHITTTMTSPRYMHGIGAQVLAGIALS